MSDNQPSFSNSGLDMIAISTVAAQLALDVHGQASMGDINRIVTRPLYLDTRERPSTVDQEFLRIWNDSQTKKDYDDFDPAVTTEASEGLKTVYRACLRALWTPPHKILSPLNELRYRSTPPAGMQASHAIFTPKFSRLFAELAVHPCWGGHSNRLILAIQYTVKVRVDDRSPWPMAYGLPGHTKKCPALEALYQMFYDNRHEIPATASLHMMHLQARADQTEAPSEFSDFLVFLGQIARM
ncbi:hypothetical protein H9Q74_000055 [Fusarium xylarioides]|nr:hypothetical protein H9Q71_000158 [Fusarium xylarioides]KAG5829902.1 hypothetical protein H9Q74_000055 [Fusarium xylarioides]